MNHRYFNKKRFTYNFPNNAAMIRFLLQAYMNVLFPFFSLNYGNITTINLDKELQYQLI